MSERESTARDYFVHESAVVEGDVTIGKDTKIWHFSKLLGPLTIGDRCSLGQNVVIEKNVTLGNNVKIQNNVSVYNGVVVEDDAFLGPSCVFTNVLNPRSHVERKTEFRPTRVGRGATVGANATVVCGHDLGDYCMIGAGAVVTGDVPAHALVVGVPARIHGWVCRCGVRLEFGDSREATCPDCGDVYDRADDTVVRLRAPGSEGRA